MKIIFIGSGNLATNLAMAFKQLGHDILQVYSRTIESANALAIKLDTAATNDIKEIRNDADLYVFSVTDTALPTLIPQISQGKEDKVFIHTAGSMPLSVFKDQVQNYGVLYPMQTFSKTREVNFRTIPCFIEANNDKAQSVLFSLANELSDKVYLLTSDERKYLHLAAVFACNFANHCYALSADILNRHNIPFEVMLPLIDETALKVHALSPIEAQTGPAVRYDENVMQKHLDLLLENPLVKEIYERMSLDIHRMAQNQ